MGQPGHRGPDPGHPGRVEGASPVDHQDLWRTLKALLLAKDGGGTEPTGGRRAGAPVVQGGPIGPEEFVYRAAANEIDTRRGLAMLWLASDDRWKTRVTEHVGIDRLDSASTVLEIDIDLSLLGSRDLAPDADGTVRLPLLAAPRPSPSIRQVTDGAGASVPRLNTTEIRRCLAAGLAHLMVRSDERLAMSANAHDLELLWAAVLRRHLVQGGRRGRPMASDTGSGLDREEHARHRTLRRLDRARRDIEAIYGADPRADVTATSSSQRPTSGLAQGARSVGRDKLLDLIAGLTDNRLLVVAVPASPARSTFRCELPERTLESRPLRPDHASLDVVRRTLFRLPVLGRRGYLTRQRRRDRRLHVSGPLGGRCDVCVDLIGQNSARNYHVVLGLPDGVQAHDPRLRFEWGFDQIMEPFRSRLGAVQTLGAPLDVTEALAVQMYRVGQDVGAMPGPSPFGNLATERAVIDLVGVSRELRGALEILRPAWARERAVPGDAGASEEPAPRPLPPSYEAVAGRLLLLGRHERKVRSAAKAAHDALLALHVQGSVRDRHGSADPVRPGGPDPVEVEVVVRLLRRVADLVEGSGPAARAHGDAGRLSWWGHGRMVRHDRPRAFDLVDGIRTFADELEDSRVRVLLDRGLVRVGPIGARLERRHEQNAATRHRASVNVRALLSGLVPRTVDPSTGRPTARAADPPLQRPPHRPLVHREYRARGAPRPDQVHIAVSATDRLPRSYPVARAELKVGLYTTDPRPHGATNLTNLVNLVVTLASAVTITMIDRSPHLAGAVAPLVAILVVVPSVQAARIARPSRTRMAGWLRAFPHTLAIWSPFPPILFACYLSGAAASKTLVEPATLVPATGLAMAAEAMLLALGVHGQREAGYWELAGRSASREPRWWDARFASPGRRSVRPPAIMFLGTFCRWLTGNRPWLVPCLGVTSGETVPLRTTVETEEMLARALPRVASLDRARPVMVLMKDGPGRLGELLRHIEAGGEAAAASGRDPDPGSGRPLAFPGMTIHASVGVALGGQSLVQLLVDDPVAEPDFGSRMAGPWEVAPAARPISLRYTTLKGQRDIVELLIQARAEPSRPRQILHEVARRLEARRFAILLVHFPAAPPHVTDVDGTWIRIRIGVGEGQEERLYRLLEDVEHDVLAPSGETCLVRSVSEFARPDAAASTHEDPIDYRDESPIGGGGATFLAVQTTARRGVLRKILDELHASGGPELVGFSASSALGIAMMAFHLDGKLGSAWDEIEPAILEELGIKPHGRDGAMCHFEVDPPAHPVERRPLDRWRVGLRVTWNTPATTGLLQAIVGAVTGADHRPNIYYVLSRVTGNRADVGRIVVRLERNVPGLEAGDDLPTMDGKALSEYASALAADVDAALRVHLHSHRTGSAPGRDVLVVVEPFVRRGS